jgi:hypothetical protein
MAYSEPADVQDLVGFELSSTSKPTEAQATALVDQVAAEVDSVLAGAGYMVPVTAPDYFLSALKLLNSAGAAAAILKVMFPDATGAAESPAYAFWDKWYRDGLARLRDGSGVPPDVTTNSAAVGPSTYFTRNPDAEEELGDIAEPFFTRSKVF